MSEKATNRFSGSKITRSIDAFDKTDALLESVIARSLVRRSPPIMKYPMEIGSNEIPHVMQFRIFSKNQDAQNKAKAEVTAKKQEKQKQLEDANQKANTARTNADQQTAVRKQLQDDADTKREKDLEWRNYLEKSGTGYGSIERSKAIDDAFLANIEAGGTGYVETTIDGSPTGGFLGMGQRQTLATGIPYEQQEAKYQQDLQNYEQNVQDLRAFKEATVGKPFDPTLKPPTVRLMPQKPQLSTLEDVPKLGSGNTPEDVQWRAQTQDAENTKAWAEAEEKKYKAAMDEKSGELTNLDNFNKRATDTSSDAQINPGSVDSANQYDQMVSIYLPFCNKINNIEAFSYGEASFGTLQGIMNLDARQAVASIINGTASPEVSAAGSITSGALINPRLQKYFQQKNIRDFTFSWEFFPRNPDESEMIRDIIYKFRYYSSPDVGSGLVAEAVDTLPAMVNSSEAFTLNYPGEFEVRFLSKLDGSYSENQWIPKISRLAITSIEVDYSPQGIWGSFTDNAPVAIVLSINATELTPLLASDIDKGF